MSKKATEFQKREMSKMYRGKEIFKPLNTGWVDERVACVREWVANIFFYRKGDTTIMIDAGYNYDRLAEKDGLAGHRPARPSGTSSSPIRTPTTWVRWRQTAPVCSGAQSSISARLKTGISPARCGERSYIISINCRRSAIHNEKVLLA